MSKGVKVRQMSDYQQLKVFHLADDLALEIYHLTQHFPNYEMHGLISQMRRTTVSIPSKIVEGCSRESFNAYRRFTEIAQGSCRELQYQFSLASRLNDVPSLLLRNACEAHSAEVERVLSALYRSRRSPS